MKNISDFHVGAFVCKERGKYKGVPGIITHVASAMYDGKPSLEIYAYLNDASGTIISGRWTTFKVMDDDWQYKPITEHALQDVSNTLDTGLNAANEWANKKIGGMSFNQDEIFSLLANKLEEVQEPKVFKPKALFRLLDAYEEFISEDGFASDDEKLFFLHNSWCHDLSNDEKEELIEYFELDK